MKVKLVVMPGRTVPRPGIFAGKIMICRPAIVAVLAPTGNVLTVTPGGNVTVPPTLRAGAPPIFAKLTVPLTTTLTDTLTGTDTVVATSAGSKPMVVAVLLAKLVSAVVVVTTPLKVCTVVLPCGMP